MTTSPIIVQHDKLVDLMDPLPPTSTDLYYACYKNYRQTTDNVRVTIAAVARWFDNGVIHSYTAYLWSLNFHPYLIEENKINQEMAQAEATLQNLITYVVAYYDITPRPGLVEISCEPLASKRWPNT